MYDDDYMIPLVKKKALPGHHHPIDYLAEANAFIGGLALYPQLYRAVKTHNVSQLSATTFLIIFVTNIVWAMYGIHRKDRAILSASALNGIAAGTLLGLQVMWR